MEIMGVIHKLKDEVIQFILQKKSQYPDLSVRRLAEIVSDRFQAKVSKSSVNTVLKSAQLSSPVGRHQAADKEKIFKIPSEKKKEWLASFASVVDVPSEPKAPVPCKSDL